MSISSTKRDQKQLVGVDKKDAACTLTYTAAHSCSCALREIFQKIKKYCPDKNVLLTFFCLLSFQRTTSFRQMPSPTSSAREGPSSYILRLSSTCSWLSPLSATSTLWLLWRRYVKYAFLINGLSFRAISPVAFRCNTQGSGQAASFSVVILPAGTDFLKRHCASRKDFHFWCGFPNRLGI